MSLLFNMMTRVVRPFYPRSKCLLISWLQSLSAVILEPKKRKSVPVSIVSPPTCPEVMGLDAMILVFWMLSFKPVFSLSSFTFIKRFCSSSSPSVKRVVSSVYLVVQWLGFWVFTAMAQVHPWKGNGDPTNHGMAKKWTQNKTKRMSPDVAKSPLGNKTTPNWEAFT